MKARKSTLSRFNGWAEVARTISGHKRVHRKE
jgi:hypothetical protein